MFKKDSMITGVILGIVVMVAGYFVIHYFDKWLLGYLFKRSSVFSESTTQVIAIFLNVFPFRYFMLKADKEWIGRGILLVTFIVGLTYFFYYLK